jgi:hypothetical protein
VDTAPKTRGLGNSLSSTQLTLAVHASSQLTVMRMFANWLLNAIQYMSGQLQFGTYFRIWIFGEHEMVRI